MNNEWEVFLTIFILCFWFLFPIGVFLSVSHVDKNTDQIIRLESLRHESSEPEAIKTIEPSEPVTLAPRAVSRRAVRP